MYAFVQTATIFGDDGGRNKIHFVILKKVAKRASSSSPSSSPFE